MQFSALAHVPDPVMRFGFFHILTQAPVSVLSGIKCPPINEAFAVRTSCVKTLRQPPASSQNSLFRLFLSCDVLSLRSESRGAGARRGGGNDLRDNNAKESESLNY